MREKLGLQPGGVDLVAAELLREAWQGRRVVELEGPVRVMPDAIATAPSAIPGRPATAEPVPRDALDDLLRAVGARNPTPRPQMIDGFNAGWIEFKAGEDGSRKGVTTIDAVLRALVARD